nr:hypothetical protein [Bacteroides finegoldii]
MGFLSGLFHSRDKPTNSTNGCAYRFLFGGSNSGKAVNERSAMQMTAVYTCVRILSESIAGLPVHIYKYTNSGSKEKAINHPGPMLFSRASVTNSLMDKLTAKCHIKKPEIPERSVDSLMERLDLIKQHI